VSSTSTQQGCDHPARDITIVALGSAVVSLVATIIVMAFSGDPLAIFAACGGAFVASLGAGTNILSHVKRRA
jgi:hypothetical protein